jgi:transposase
VRKNNPAKSTIIVVHSLKSYEVADVKAEAKGLGIGLVSLPPYCPHPTPIGRMWKNVKNVMSTRLARHVNDMRNIIKKTFYQLTKNLNLSATRLDEFIVPRFNYISSCRRL